MKFCDLMDEVNFYFPVFEKIVNKHRREQKTGRPRIDLKKLFATIMFVNKTGIQWGMVPPSDYLVDGTTAHDNFQFFERKGIIKEFFAVAQQMYDDNVGYKLRWVAADCTIIQTRVIALPLGQENTGRNPTDRGRPGTKISAVVDQTGAIMGSTIGPANKHDSKFLVETLVQGSLVQYLNKDYVTQKKHLCLDKGYDGNNSEECAYNYGYESHIRTRGEEIIEKKNGKRARRFVVEAHWARMKSFRHIRTRFTKYCDNFRALTELASSRFLFKRMMSVISGPITSGMIPEVDMDDRNKWLEMQRA